MPAYAIRLCWRVNVKKGGALRTVGDAAARVWNAYPHFSPYWVSVPQYATASEMQCWSWLVGLHWLRAMQWCIAGRNAGELIGGYRVTTIATDHIVAPPQIDYTGIPWRLRSPLAPISAFHRLGHSTSEHLAVGELGVTEQTYARLSAIRRRSCHGNSSANSLCHEVEESPMPEVRRHDQHATDPLQALSSAAEPSQEVTGFSGTVPWIRSFFLARNHSVCILCADSFASCDRVVPCVLPGTVCVLQRSVFMRTRRLDDTLLTGCASLSFARPEVRRLFHPRRNGLIWTRIRHDNSSGGD